MHYVFLDPDGTNHSTISLYVIVAAATGVTYATQCAGVANNERSLEGFLVPVGGAKLDAEQGRLDSNAFREVFHGEKDQCYWGDRHQVLPPARMNLLATRVAEIPYWISHPPGSVGREARLALKLDVGRSDEIAEAWVPVVTPDGPGILTWDNCD